MTRHYGLATPLLQRAFHHGTLKLIVQADGFAELYDLDADPFERTNLAGDADHPASLSRMMRGLSDALRASGDMSGPAALIHAAAGPLKP